MKTSAAHQEIIRQLQKEINTLQGMHAAPDKASLTTGLSALEAAFPEGVFPTAAIHEFLSYAPADAAATNGFIAALMSKLIKQQGTCIWISTRRFVYPPAMKFFGMEPERIIFIDLLKSKEALWVMEEALKSTSVATVVAELNDLSFTESRRLQLAVEQSRVTGFLHRYYPKNEQTLACVSRWKIKPLSSSTGSNMPGVGHPRWEVQLLKIKNGRPGKWPVEWTGNNFAPVTVPAIAHPATLKTA